MDNKTKRQRFLLLQAFFLLLLMVFSVCKAEAAVMDFGELGDLEGISDEIYTTIENNILDSSDNIIGTLKTTVYRSGSDYIYVLYVTPFVEDTYEFNMGLFFWETGNNGDYGDYGYDYAQAATAFSTSEGDGTFSISIDSDNTIDWNVTSSSYSWSTGEGITFFFEHSSAPETGFYNLAASSNGYAYGYVPAAVPIPGTFLLLVSSFIGIIGFRKKYQSDR